MAKKQGKIEQVNPFLASFSIKPIIKYTEWAVTKGGDAPIGSAIKLPKLVDFNEGSWYDGLNFMLLHTYSTSALQIFGYIMMHLRWNQDYIQIKPNDEFNPEQRHKLVMSKTSFYNGISELIQRGIIAKRIKSASTYWINPAIMFKGNRLQAFKDYVINPLGKPGQES